MQACGNAKEGCAVLAPGMGNRFFVVKDLTAWAQVYR
jgi:hypothetical protein